MTKTTYAQQAAAAARNEDYDNAAALYNRAALEADMLGHFAKARRHDEQARRFERLAVRDHPDMQYPA